MKRISAIAFILLVAALVLYLCGYMPGSIRQDANGFIHGSGKTLYRYDAGPVMLEEHYLAGRLKFSRWFRPDGTLIAETRWKNGNGVGYYLRQDGTVRFKCEHQGGLAHGLAVYYKEDGVTVDHAAEYRHGRKLEAKD